MQFSLWWFLFPWISLFRERTWLWFIIIALHILLLFLSAYVVPDLHVFQQSLVNFPLEQHYLINLFYSYPFFFGVMGILLLSKIIVWFESKSVWSKTQIVSWIVMNVVFLVLILTNPVWFYAWHWAWYWFKEDQRIYNNVVEQAKTMDLVAPLPQEDDFSLPLFVKTPELALIYLSKRHLLNEQQEFSHILYEFEYLSKDQKVGNLLAYFDLETQEISSLVSLVDWESTLLLWSWDIETLEKQYLDSKADKLWFWERHQELIKKHADS